MEKNWKALELCLNRGPNKDVSYVVALDEITGAQENFRMDEKEYIKFFGDLAKKDVWAQADLFIAYKITPPSPKEEAKTE